MNKLLVVVSLVLCTELFAAGDSILGEEKASLCKACHDPNISDNISLYPKINGQTESYILKQLQDIKSQVRLVPEMNAILPAVKEDDFADIAAYFANMPPPVSAAQPELVSLGRTLYRSGKPEVGMPSCMGCHAADGKGIMGAPYPRLAGQHAEYITKQLTSFRENIRTNDGDASPMRFVASRLTDTEIKALSQYIQGLR